MATNSIVEKIAKLLALGKSLNESEAMQAIRMAQKLMSKYSIEQSEVDEATGQMGNDFVKQTVSLDQARFKNWEKYLMMYICESNFCKVVFCINSDDVIIYGTKYDSEMSVALYAFVRPQMLKMAQTAHKLAFTSINANEWKVSYYMGMNSKIQKLLKQVLQITADESNSTAIVLKKNELVAQFFDDNKGKVVDSKVKYIFNGNAYQQGFKDGDRLELGIEAKNKQIA